MLTSGSVNHVLISSNDTVIKAKIKLDKSNSESEQISSDFELMNQDIQQKKAKKGQSEASLYGGKIHNPKELQDLQLEIASLTKILADLDDQLLEKLMILDESENKIKTCEEEYKEAISAFETSKSRLVAEKGNLENAIHHLNTKRSSVVVQIDPASMNTYESLRKAKKGLAIAHLQEDSCSACGSSLTASQCQQVRSTSQLFLCPFCGRIIYGS
jgi:predicted  nucleic acid-binding Zn-ribbon protein